jgi:transcriptional regulator with XRE-family HTH domain
MGAPLQKLTDPFWSNVRQFRITNGLSTSRFAEMVGVSESYLSNIERSKYLANDSVLQKIKKLINT